MLVCHQTERNKFKEQLTILAEVVKKFINNLLKIK